MATNEKIITAIREGNARVQQTFGPLSDAQLQTKVHDGENGWTAKEILAHLAGRQSTYDLLVHLAGSNAAPPAGGFDIDAWNQEIVNARRDKSRDELLTEFHTTHNALIERVRGMSNAELQQTLTLRHGPVSLDRVAQNSGGTHSVAHAREVEQALGISSPTA